MKNKQLCLFNHIMDIQTEFETYVESIVLHDPSDIYFVELLLRKGVDVNRKDFVSYNHRNHINCTLLHQASIKGYFNIAELLLKNNADVNCLDNRNNTPLHLASIHGHLNIIKLLLEYDANVNCLNEYCNTPLHNSSDMGHIDVITVLIKNGADVNCTNVFNDTPLHISSSNGYTDIVELLLINGANMDNEHGLITSKHRPWALALNNKQTSTYMLLQQWRNKQHPLQIASDVIKTDFHSYINCHIPEVVELICEFLHLPVKQVYVAD